MTNRTMAVGWVLAAYSCASVAQLVSAQTSGSSDNSPNTVRLSKLSPPAYPPLARQARIEGDVEVAVRVRPDGRIESAAIISGPPILGPAVLLSAQKSDYECRACDGVVPFTAVYTFKLPMKQEPAKEWNGEPPPADIVSQSQNHITVINNEPGRLIVERIRTPVRSAKCLYLWRCGNP